MCSNGFTQLMDDKVNKPNISNLVTHLKQTPILFEWCVIRCGSKIKHQKCICLKEIIILHAQNLLIILSSIINIIRKRIFNLIMNKIHVQLSSRNYEKNDKKHNMDLPIIDCANCVFHIPQKVGYESSLHQNVKTSLMICAYNHMRSVR